MRQPCYNAEAFLTNYRKYNKNRWSEKDEKALNKIKELISKKNMQNRPRKKFDLSLPAKKESSEKIFNNTSTLLTSNFNDINKSNKLIDLEGKQYSSSDEILLIDLEKEKSNPTFITTTTTSDDSTGINDDFMPNMPKKKLKTDDKPNPSSSFKSSEHGKEKSSPTPIATTTTSYDSDDLENYPLKVSGFPEKSPNSQFGEIKQFSFKYNLYKNNRFEPIETTLTFDNNEQNLHKTARAIALKAFTNNWKQSDTNRWVKKNQDIPQGVENLLTSKPVALAKVRTIGGKPWWLVATNLAGALPVPIREEIAKDWLHVITATAVKADATNSSSDADLVFNRVKPTGEAVTIKSGKKKGQSRREQTPSVHAEVILKTFADEHNLTIEAIGVSYPGGICNLCKTFMQIRVEKIASDKDRKPGWSTPGLLKINYHKKFD